MRLPQKFLALPTSLLLLLISSPCAAHAENQDQSLARWPDEHPINVEFPPEDASHRRRALEDIQYHILAGHAPVAVKKMSEDESEKFFPEYWGFREQVNQFAIFGNGPVDASSGWSLRKEFEEEEAKMLVNKSTILSIRPPFLVRARAEASLSRRDIQAVWRAKGGRSAAAVLALLEKRQFSCPAGTAACSNAPSLCCAPGETCVTVQDTGIGTIGCCPSGYSCSGTIQCVAGNTPCASDIGGGCCIPGDVCATVGCVPSAAATSAVTVVRTISQGSPSSVNVVVVTTVVTPSISASTSTLTLTASTSTTPVTTTNTATPDSTVTTDTTATITSASAPVRASSTSDTARVTTISTTSTTSTSSSTDSSCPTGFYACSAYYAGGCCRTGRDCATTDCPSTAYTTLISSGVTIVVPLTGAATTTASGTCPTGWYGCAATDGGSCCPSGWSCGPESCTSAGPTSTQTEAKEGLLFSGGVRFGMGHVQLLSVLCLMIFLLLIA